MQIDSKSRTLDLDPRDPAFVQNPAAAYARLLADCPAFYWRQRRQWCFADFATVNAILRSRRFGRKADGGFGFCPARPTPAFDQFSAHSFFEREGPDHARLRGLVAPLFHKRLLRGRAAEVARLAHGLIDRMAAQGRADLLADFATPLSVLSIFEIMGVDARHGQAVAALGHRMVRRYLACCDEAMAQDAEQAAAEFARLIPKLAQAAPAESGLARLRAAEETGTISASDMTASAMLLLTAGHEALALALVNVVQLLLDRGIRQGITPGHVEEALRLAPPMQLFTRHALRDMTVAGVTLKAGDSVGLLLAAANLDPQRFAHPHAFNPARTPNPHLAFSAGVHFCLGAPLARLQLQTAIPLLFQRLPGLRLAAPAAMADLYHLHGPQQLAVIW